MNPYRYGFNGKENDNEVKGEGNQIDYGMRVYDPRIGKFLSVDPLTKSFPMLPPYQYASNGPIANIDMDGLEKLHFTYRLSEQGSPVLNYIGTEDFVEEKWGWAPKMGGTGFGFQLWQKTAKHNPRQEYVVHGVAPVTLGTGGEMGDQMTEVTWTFSSFSDMTKAANSDGKHGEMSWLTADQRGSISFGLAMYNGLQAEGEVGAAKGLWFGKVQSLNAEKIRFSQSSVTGAEEIIESMRSKGWKGDPIDVVLMKDGVLTSVDNTRLSAARVTNTLVNAIVHGFDEVIPADQAGRFINKKTQAVPTIGEKRQCLE